MILNFRIQPVVTAIFISLLSVTINNSSAHPIGLAFPKKGYTVNTVEGIKLIQHHETSSGQNMKILLPDTDHAFSTVNIMLSGKSHKLHYPVVFNITNNNQISLPPVVQQKNQTLFRIIWTVSGLDKQHLNDMIKSKSNAAENNFFSDDYAVPRIKLFFKQKLKGSLTALPPATPNLLPLPFNIEKDTFGYMDLIFEGSCPAPLCNAVLQSDAINGRYDQKRRQVIILEYPADQTEAGSPNRAHFACVADYDPASTFFIKSTKHAYEYELRIHHTATSAAFSATSTAANRLLDYIRKHQISHPDKAADICRLSSDFMDEFLPGLRKMDTPEEAPAGDHAKKSRMPGASSCLAMKSLWDHLLRHMVKAKCFEHEKVRDLWYKVTDPLASEIYTYCFYLAGESEFNDSLPDEIQISHSKMTENLQHLLQEIYHSKALPKAHWPRQIHNIKNRWNSMPKASRRRIYSLFKMIYEQDDYRGFLQSLIIVRDDYCSAVLSYQINLSLQRYISDLFNTYIVPVPIAPSNTRKMVTHCQMAKDELRLPNEVIALFPSIIRPRTTRMMNNMCGLITHHLTEEAMGGAKGVILSYEKAFESAYTRHMRGKNVTPAKTLSTSLEFKKLQTQRTKAIMPYRQPLIKCYQIHPFMSNTDRSALNHKLSIAWTEEIYKVVHILEASPLDPGQQFEHLQAIRPVLNCFTFNKEYLYAHNRDLCAICGLYRVLLRMNQPYKELTKKIKLARPPSPLSLETIRELTWWMIYHDTLIHPVHLEEHYGSKSGYADSADSKGLELYKNLYGLSRQNVRDLLLMPTNDPAFIMGIVDECRKMIMARAPETSPELLHGARCIMVTTLTLCDRWFRSKAYGQVDDQGKSHSKTASEYQYSCADLNSAQQEQLETILRLVAWSGWLIEKGARGTLSEKLKTAWDQSTEAYQLDKLEIRTRKLVTDLLHWMNYTEQSSFTCIDEIVLKHWPTGRSCLFHVPHKESQAIAVKEDTPEPAIVKTPPSPFQHEPTESAMTSPVSPAKSNETADAVPVAAMVTTEPPPHIAAPDLPSPGAEKTTTPPRSGRSPQAIFNLKYNHVSDNLSRATDLIFHGGMVSQPGTMSACLQFIEGQLQTLQQKGVEITELNQKYHRLRFFEQSFYQQWTAGEMNTQIDLFATRQGNPVDLLKIIQWHTISDQTYDALIPKVVNLTLETFVRQYIPLQYSAVMPLLNTIHRLDIEQLSILDNCLDEIRSLLFQTTGQTHQIIRLDAVYFELLRVRLHRLKKPYQREAPALSTKLKASHAG